VVKLENLTEALLSGKGAVLVSGHFFAIRMAKRYLASLGYPSLSVRNLYPADAPAGRFGKRFLLPRYVEFLSQIARTESSTKDPDRSLKMLARLRTGALIDVLFEGSDDSSARQIIRRAFLGCKEEFATGYLHLAWVAGAPLVPMFCVGSSRDLRIEFGEPLRPEKWPDRSRFAEEGLSLILRLVEEHIRKTPEEWDLGFDGRRALTRAFPSGHHANCQRFGLRGSRRGGSETRRSCRGNPGHSAGLPVFASRRDCPLPARLAEYKIPRRITIADSLEVEITGKRPKAWKPDNL